MKFHIDTHTHRKLLIVMLHLNILFQATIVHHISSQSKRFFLWQTMKILWKSVFAQGMNRKVKMPEKSIPIMGIRQTARVMSMIQIMGIWFKNPTVQSSTYVLKVEKALSQLWIQANDFKVHECSMVGFFLTMLFLIC